MNAASEERDSAICVLPTLAIISFLHVAQICFINPRRPSVIHTSGAKAQFLMCIVVAAEAATHKAYF